MKESHPKLSKTMLSLFQYQNLNLYQNYTDLPQRNLIRVIMHSEKSNAITDLPRYIIKIAKLPKIKLKAFWKLKRHWKPSHKKRKDSLETRGIMLMFSLELEISGVAVQGIHQNNKRSYLLWVIALWKRFLGCLNHLLLLWPWCQHIWDSSEDLFRSKRLS